MSLIKQVSEAKFDAFLFRTRQQPSFIMLFPLVLIAVAWAKPEARWLSTLWSLISAAGITFFLGNNARNKGKALEPSLYKEWGGTPTTQLLRHRGPANEVLRQRWHLKLAALLGAPMPTREDEAANPSKADATYEASIKLLIGKTRDAKTYPFVYRDNVNYNFCRNLFAFRAEGIFTSLIGLIACSAAGIRGLPSTHPDYMPWGCAAICLCLLYWWWRTINSGWVKIPAFNYAQHLLEATEKIPSARKIKSE